MKKIILNIIFILMLASIITTICIAGVFLKDINSAPQLLVHIIPTDGTFPYYVVQHGLIKSWRTNCVAIIVVASVSALIPFLGLVYINIPALSKEARVKRRELQKAKKIQALEAELEELKND